MAVPTRNSVFFAAIATLKRLLLRLYEGCRPRKIILYSNNPLFTRKLKAYASLLRRRGFRVQVLACQSLGYSEESRGFLRSNPDLWILFSGRVIPYDSLPENFIFYIADPIDRHRPHNWVDEEYFRIMQKAQQVWSYSPAAEKTVAGTGLPFHVVPFGYTASYEQEFQKNVRRLKCGQDIDVLFFGRMSGRRASMLERLKKRGMAVVVLDESNAVYGEKLDSYLVRSKMVLCLYYHDDPETWTPDFARIDYLLANRIFVLHEKPAMEGGVPEFEKHITTSPYEEIPKLCGHFLAEPEERVLRSGKARDWFKSRYDLEDWIPYGVLKKQLRA